MAEMVATVLPTGGAIMLALTNQASGDWTLTRTMGDTSVILDEGTATTTGPWCFLDTGDGAPAPLLPSATYSYAFTDPLGTAESGPLMPVASIDLERDQMLHIMIRLLQGAFSAMTLPDGIDKPQVRNAMPLIGFPPMPFVVIYPELIQQEEVPIGVDVPNPDPDNIWQNHEVARRVFRVSVLSRNAGERDYLRDAIIAVFRSSLAYFLTEIGQDMRQRWQGASYQNSADNKGELPGFYGCDLMLEFSGVFQLAIITSYGIIEKIDGAADAGIEYVGEPTEINIEVPTTDG